MSAQQIDTPRLIPGKSFRKWQSLPEGLLIRYGNYAIADVNGIPASIAFSFSTYRWTVLSAAVDRGRNFIGQFGYLDVSRTMETLA